jgi:hypothetical protein
MLALASIVIGYAALVASFGPVGIIAVGIHIALMLAFLRKR